MKFSKNFFFILISSLLFSMPAMAKAPDKCASMKAAVDQANYDLDHLSDNDPRAEYYRPAQESARDLLQDQYAACLLSETQRAPSLTLGPDLAQCGQGKCAPQVHSVNSPVTVKAPSRVEYTLPDLNFSDCNQGGCPANTPSSADSTK